MTYTPSPKRRFVNVVTAALLVPALAAYMFSVSGTGHPLPLQLAALVLVCTAVYILIRYRFTRITYRIRPRSASDADRYGDDVAAMPPEAVDFVIEKAQGQRPGAVECMISLVNLVEVRDIDGGSWRAEVRHDYPGVSLYIYTVSLGRVERQALIFDDGGVLSCVVTELSPEMIRFMRSAAERTRPSDDSRGASEDSDGEEH